MVMAKLNISKGEEQKVKYRLPYEDTMSLLEKGLIKETKTAINQKVEDNETNDLPEQEIKE